MFTQRQIGVFRAIISTGSVTSAARRLNLSQPSVSRLLNELETQFGCPLFVRGSRGVLPTPEANLFFEEVERTYGVLTTLEDVARDITRRQRGVLNFGAIAAFCFEVVPRALGRLGVQDHDMAVNWRVRNSEQLINWALNGNLALGLAYIEGELSGLRVISRTKVPHLCLLPAAHALSQGEGPLRLKDLSQERIIALLGVTADIVHRQRIGLKNASPIVVETSYAAAALAETTGAVAIVDPFTARWFTKSGNLKARLIPELAAYEAALFEPMGTQNSILNHDFQQYLIAEIEAVASRVQKSSSH